jgi:hypothetical protein
MVINVSKTWGPVISSEGEEDKEDPIIILIQKYEDVKTAKYTMGDNETLNEVHERRRQELYKIDKQIWDLIYQKKLREA